MGQLAKQATLGRVSQSPAELVPPRSNSPAPARAFEPGGASPYGCTGRTIWLANPRRMHDRVHLWRAKRAYRDVRSRSSRLSLLVGLARHSVYRKRDGQCRGRGNDREQEEWNFSYQPSSIRGSKATDEQDSAQIRHRRSTLDERPDQQPSIWAIVHAGFRTVSVGSVGCASACLYLRSAS
jgi:hypothetical protein